MAVRGGVVAMFVRTTLELNADINVSGTGFRGAIVSELYNGECSSDDLDLYDSTFYHIDNIRAGKKGEGTTDTRFDLMRGKAMNINGGGGGNARLSGGGGGSNFSAGGRGGNESTECSPGVEAPGGAAGFDLGRSDAYYINGSSQNRENRIFFGGGGGTGTEIAGRNSSNGGDGGGLVVIVADTIIGNGNWIIADGFGVAGIATGAGGGGGGGGAIILDVSGYKNNLQLSAVGGDGGDTHHASDTTGPGGGGGGGIYWLAGSNEPEVNPDDVSFGNSGDYLSTPIWKHGASFGSEPARKDGLKAPLRGFLFNSVPGEFRVCSDQVPETIRASEPRGGSGSYEYTWVDSSSTQNQWQLIPGATGQSLSFSGSLADTTYFRRIVNEVPSILPADTSFRIAVYVHQAISNNVIVAPDTVCEGLIPLPFISMGLPGNGDGDYVYLWQKDEGSGYFDADGTNSGSGYVPPSGLDITTDFRRVVTSGACVDTIAELRVTVFGAISGNLIADNDTICVNTVPDLIVQDPAEVLGGGDPDPTNWRYQWESSLSGTGSWVDVPGATAPGFQPGSLSSTIWYRREVFSGNDDACTDLSNAVVVLNVAAISNNTIDTDDQTICSGDQPLIMQGSVPGGGHAGYSYQWQSYTESTGWISADPANGNSSQNYPPPVLDGDTTQYRRIVNSGGQEGVCQDISLTKTINVLPPIVNNNILADVMVNCQFDQLAELTSNPNGLIPGGGATQGGNDPTRSYRWEMATGEDTPGTWAVVSYGVAELDYTASPVLDLEDDYWFRRVVLSGPDLGGQDQVCSDISNAIHIEIHTAISNNLIDASDSVCYETEKDLNGELPGGENDDILYLWRDVVSGAELGTTMTLPYVFSSLDARQFERIVVIGECEDTSALMDIVVMELPGGILSGDLPKACEKLVLLDVNLNIDDLTNYVTPWEISLSDGVNSELTDPQLIEADGSVEVSLSTDEISTLYNYTIGSLVYTLTDGTVCAARAGVELGGSVAIEVFLTPDPVITVTDPDLVDGFICDNEVSLAVDPDHGNGTWESSYPDDLGFLPGPEDVSIRASLDPADSLAWLKLPYTIWFTSHAGDCSGSDTVKISFFEQPESADAGTDDTIYLRNSTWLNANPATAGEGTWTVNSGTGIFEDEHAHNTFVSGLAKGVRNEFKWTIVNGVCITSDDRSVITQDKAQPYEGFSPNGDNINDYFIIRGLKDATTFSVYIFNALGQTVREITHENVDEIDFDEATIPGGLRDDERVVWDGLAKNGNPVPSGTYYYVLSVSIDQAGNGGTDKQQKKHYIIVRD